MLIQVTPAYPPEISGVGDHAALLAAAFRAEGVLVATLVASRVRGAPLGRQGEATELCQAASGALADALQGTNRVLLHFSGYGYARWGLCRWIVDGLKRWKAGGEERRLVTMFHEVYATGPIWHSSFWTEGPQRRIARNLAKLSDAGFMSSLGGQKQLASLAPELRVNLLPVFSNIGEPELSGPLAERAGRAVVFGGKSRRRKVYEALRVTGEDLRRALEDIGVTEFVDIGPEIDAPREVAGCAVTRLGTRPAEEVSATLSDARIGLIDYPGHVFTKSGIAAAYFAHRLLVVNTSLVGGFPPDLQEGRHFASLERVANGCFDAQAIADAGHEWYRPHGIAATTETFLACLL